MDKELEQILKDYAATASSGKYNSWEEIDSKFPELKDYDSQILRDYAATASSGKYSTWEEINSKFPEFSRSEKKSPNQMVQPEVSGAISGMQAGTLASQQVTSGQQSPTEILQSNKDVPFVDRVLNPDKYPTLPAGDGAVKTHRLAYAGTDDGAIVFPMIHWDGKKLVDFEKDPQKAIEVAKQSGNIINFNSEEEADKFTKSYKEGSGLGGNLPTEMSPISPPSPEPQKPKTTSEYYLDMARKVDTGEVDDQFASMPMGSQLKENFSQYFKDMSSKTDPKRSKEILDELTAAEGMTEEQLNEKYGVMAPAVIGALNKEVGTMFPGKQMERFDKKVLETANALGKTEDEFRLSLKRFEQELLDDEDKAEYDLVREIEAAKLSGEDPSIFEDQLFDIREKRKNEINDEIAESEKYILSPADSPHFDLGFTESQIKEFYQANIDRLKLKEQGLFKPEDQLKTVYAEKAEEINRFAGDTPREKLKKYLDALYMEKKEIESRVKFSDKYVGTAMEALRNISGSTFRQISPDEERLSEIDRTIGAIAPAALLNRNPGGELDEGIPSVFLKSALGSAIGDLYTGQTQQSGSKRLKQALNIAGISEGDLVYGSQEQIDRLSKPYENYSGKDFAQLFGTTTGIIPHFAVGAGVTNAALKGTKLWKGITRLAKEGVLTEAQVAQAQAILRDGTRMQKIATQGGGWIRKVIGAGAKGGTEFGTTGLLFAQDEDAGFLQGLVGGSAGKLVTGGLGGAANFAGKKIQNLFGITAPSEAKKIFDLIIEKGVGETVEEAGEEIVDIWESTEVGKTFWDEFENRYGTIGEKAHFLVSSFVMGNGMGVGSYLGIASTGGIEGQLMDQASNTTGIPDNDMRVVEDFVEEFRQEGINTLEELWDHVINEVQDTDTPADTQQIEVTPEQDAELTAAEAEMDAIQQNIELGNSPGMGDRGVPAQQAIAEMGEAEYAITQVDEQITALEQRLDRATNIDPGNWTDVERQSIQDQINERQKVRSGLQQMVDNPTIRENRKVQEPAQVDEAQVPPQDQPTEPVNEQNQDKPGQSPNDNYTVIRDENSPDGYKITNNTSGNEVKNEASRQRIIERRRKEAQQRGEPETIKDKLSRIDNQSVIDRAIERAEQENKKENDERQKEKVDTPRESNPLPQANVSPPKSKKKKAREKNPVVRRAISKLGRQDTMSPREAVIFHFLSGGRIDRRYIEILFNNDTTEKRKRKGYISESRYPGQTIDDMAHTLWENRREGDSTSSMDFKNAIEEVVREFNSRGGMATDIIGQQNKAEIQEEAAAINAEFMALNEVDLYPIEELEESDGVVQDLMEAIPDEVLAELSARDISDSELLSQLQAEEDLARRTKEADDTKKVLESDVADARAKVASAQNELKKKKDAATKAGKANQLDLMGRAESMEMLFQPDLSVYANNVKKAKAKLEEAKDNLAKAEAKLKEWQPANQAKIDSPVNENQEEIKRILKQAGYDIFNMAGNRNSDLRQRVIELATGTRPPKSKSGINAVKNALYELAGIDSDTEAGKAAALKEWAKESKAKPSTKEKAEPKNKKENDERQRLYEKFSKEAADRILRGENPVDVANEINERVNRGIEEFRKAPKDEVRRRNFDTRINEAGLSEVGRQAAEIFRPPVAKSGDGDAVYDKQGAAHAPYDGYEENGRVYKGGQYIEREGKSKSKKIRVKIPVSDIQALSDVFDMTTGKEFNQDGEQVVYAYIQGTPAQIKALSNILGERKRKKLVEAKGTKNEGKSFKFPAAKVSRIIQQAMDMDVNVEAALEASGYGGIEWDYRDGKVILPMRGRDVAYEYSDDVHRLIKREPKPSTKEKVEPKAEPVQETKGEKVKSLDQVNEGDVVTVNGEPGKWKVVGKGKNGIRIRNGNSIMNDMTAGEIDSVVERGDRSKALDAMEDASQRAKDAINRLRNLGISSNPEQQAKDLADLTDAVVDYIKAVMAKTKMDVKDAFRHVRDILIDDGIDPEHFDQAGAQHFIDAVSGEGNIPEGSTVEAKDQKGKSRTFTYKDGKWTNESGNPVPDSSQETLNEKFEANERAKIDELPPLPDDVDTPPKGKNKKPGGKGTKAVATRAAEGANNREVGEAIRDLGLNYERQSHATAQKRARAFIDDVGMDSALQAVRNGDVIGAVAAFVYSESIDRITTELVNATDPAQISELMQQQVNLVSELDKTAREDKGRFISALGTIYEQSGFGFRVGPMKARYKKANNGEISKEMEETIERLAQQMQDLENKLKEAEAKLKESQEQAAVDAIAESVRRERQKENKAKARDKKIQRGKQRALDKFKKAKKGLGGTTNMFGMGKAAQEMLAAAVEYGYYLVQEGAVNFAEWSKKMMKDLGITQDQATRLWNEEYEGQRISDSGAQGTTGGRAKIPHQLLRDLVESGVDNMPDLVAGVRDAMPELKNLSDSQIRDSITGYGKTREYDQDDINREIGRLKSIGRMISQLQDIRAGRRPKKTGQQRREMTPRERELARKVREEMKNLPLDDEAAADQLRSALDAIKARLRNQIESYDRAIKSGEKLTRSKGIAYDAEADQLVQERNKIKEEYDKLFNTEGITDEQRIDRAIKALDRSLERLDNQIANNDIEFKEQRQITSPEIESRRKLLKEKREEIQKMREEAGILEERRLEQAKKRLRKSIDELNQRISDRDFVRRKKKNNLPNNAEVNRLRAERAKLREEFDHHLYVAELSNRKNWEVIADIGFEAWNVFRAIKATAEWSFVLIQGGLYTVAHPISAFNALKDAARVWASQANYEKIYNKMRSTEDYRQMKEDGLALTGKDPSFDAREEQYISGWVNHIYDYTVGLPAFAFGKRGHQWFKDNFPVHPRAFERAASTFLNSIRIARYSQGSQMLEMQGKTRETHPQDYKNVANVVNTFTGRSSLGSLEMASKPLAVLFFSPRMWASVLKQTILLPLWMPTLGSEGTTGTAFGRKLSAKGKIFGRDVSVRIPQVSAAQKMIMADYMKYVGFTGAIVMMAYAAMDDDDKENFFDPRSSDFMKLKFGNTRLDPWGGRQQQIVLAARLISQSVVSGSGKNRKVIPLGADSQHTPKSLLGNMVANKLAPTAAMFNKYFGGIVGKNGELVDQYGNPVDIDDQVIANLYPIYFETIKEVHEDQPVSFALFLDFLGFLGMGASVYSAKKKKAELMLEAAGDKINPKPFLSDVPKGIGFGGDKFDTEGKSVAKVTKQRDKIFISRVKELERERFYKEATKAQRMNIIKDERSRALRMARLEWLIDNGNKSLEKDARKEYKSLKTRKISWLKKHLEEKETGYGIRK